MNEAGHPAWIGDPTTNRIRLHGGAWEYADPRNQNIAVDAAKQGVHLPALDARIEALEAMGDSRASELRMRRSRAIEEHAKPASYIRHLEWISKRLALIDDAVPVVSPGMPEPASSESERFGRRAVKDGNGPVLWTISNAAAAIAAQEGWHEGARDTLRNQMMQAAHDGPLTVRHPHTGLPYRPKTVRDFYELVTSGDVNSWLAADVHIELRWRVDAENQAAAQERPMQVMPAQETTGETSDQRCARVLRWLREEEAKQLRGALARVAKRDGRARQTVSADIAKAREKEAAGADPIAAMARIVQRSPAVSLPNRRRRP